MIHLFNSDLILLICRKFVDMVFLFFLLRSRKQGTPVLPDGGQRQVSSRSLESGTLGDLHCEGFTGILHPFLEASGATEVELNIAHISQIMYKTEYCTKHLISTMGLLISFRQLELRKASVGI